LMGDLSKKAEISRVSMTLGTLLQNGIPIMKALETTVTTVTNELLRKDIKSLIDAVSKGGSLGESLRFCKFFPLFVINMVSVGEKVGNLEKSFVKIADYYSREVDRKSKFMMSLLEPLMIVVLGGMVALIVFSMLLPIFQMNLAVR